MDRIYRDNLEPDLSWRPDRDPVEIALVAVGVVVLIILVFVNASTLAGAQAVDRAESPVAPLIADAPGDDTFAPIADELVHGECQAPDTDIDCEADVILEALFEWQDGDGAPTTVRPRPWTDATRYARAGDLVLRWRKIALGDCVPTVTFAREALHRAANPLPALLHLPTSR
jgi:hypothetical protein